MAATILPFIRDAAFGPEALASMGEAFDRACAVSAQIEPVVREVIAERIIALAKAGERDPQVLCDRALEAIRSPYAERSA